MGNNVEDDDDTISKNQGIHNIQTPMFDPHNSENPKKLNYYIKRNFQKKEVNIPEELTPFTKCYDLERMLDFSRPEFDKVIRTNLVDYSTNAYAYKYETLRISDLLCKIDGSTTKIEANQIKMEGKYPVITQSKGEMISGYTDSEAAICDLPLVVFGDHSCTFKYLDYKFVRGADGTQLMKFNSEKCNTKFAYYYLSSIDVPNAGKYERHYKYVKNIMLPIPSLEIQEMMVAECEKYDAEIDEILRKNVELQNKINRIVDTIFGKGYPEKTIQDISRKVQYGTSNKSQKEGAVAVIRMGNIQNGKLDCSS